MSGCGDGPVQFAKPSSKSLIINSYSFFSLPFLFLHHTYNVIDLFLQLKKVAIHYFLHFPSTNKTIDFWYKRNNTEVWQLLLISLLRCYIAVLSYLNINYKGQMHVFYSKVLLHACL